MGRNNSFKQNVDHVRKTLDDYKQLTIAAVKAKNSRLNTLKDSDIEALYHKYSGITASAGWLHHSDQTIDRFIKWATTAPCDLIINNSDL